METRARAARPASRKGFVMERDLKDRDAEIDLNFQPSVRPQRHTLMTSRKDAKKISALSSLFASSRAIPQAPAEQSSLLLTSTRPSKYGTEPCNESVCLYVEIYVVGASLKTK